MGSEDTRTADPGGLRAEAERIVGNGPGWASQYAYEVLRAALATTGQPAPKRMTAHVCEQCFCEQCFRSHTPTAPDRTADPGGLREGELEMALRSVIRLIRPIRLSQDVEQAGDQSEVAIAAVEDIIAALIPEAALDTVTADPGGLREALEFIADWAHDCIDPDDPDTMYGFEAIEKIARFKSNR